MLMYPYLTRGKNGIHHFHLHIDHNAPCFLPQENQPNKKTKLCLTIVFDFSWDDNNTQEN